MTSRQTIKRQVERILRNAGIIAPPVDIEMVARLQGAKIQHGVLPDELSGLLYKEKGPEKPIIGVNSTHAPVRQRFTIAHELGHLILHKESVHIDRIPSVKFRDGRSSTATSSTEIEANQFAAELLMPAKLLNMDLGGQTIDMADENLLSQLAQRYQVSVQSMIYRLINLDYIQKNKHY